MSNKNNISLQICGENFKIYFSRHAVLERCIERGVSQFAIASLVVALGEELLNLKSSECKEFAIFDDVLKEGAVCSMGYCLDEDCYEIDVITVLKTDNVWVKRGTKVLKLENITSKVEFN